MSSAPQLRTPGRPRPHEEVAARRPSVSAFTWCGGTMWSLTLGCFAMLPFALLAIGVAARFGHTFMSEENAALSWIVGGVLSTCVIVLFVVGHLLLTLSSRTGRRRYWLINTAWLFTPAALFTAWPELWTGWGI